MGGLGGSGGPYGKPVFNNVSDPVCRVGPDSSGTSLSCGRGRRSHDPLCDNEEVSYLLPLADEQAARRQPGSDPRQAVNPSVPERHAVECCRLAERD
ncbi:hypothetical protein EYF80_038479 [Liparis tanakae]|uniref:Uncharacterized protein n=1 Tax=Liparis tanakae TaxID=230148 RepID=A0A4Z2GDV7_9TELE|nr:hypothetical protein EYF80_038479 [Liparis tanakae]